MLLETARPVDVEVSVYDLLGRRVEGLWQGEMVGSRELRSSALAPGLYLVRTVADGEVLAVRRAVVTR